MPGRITKGSTPRHLKATKGKRGWAQSDASGQLFYADEMVDDVRQGRVHRTEADIMAGFGTYHPQDLKVLGELDDPHPIHKARPIDTHHQTKEELGYSDAEIEASVRQGRPPRRGY